MPTIERIPRDASSCTFAVGERRVELTHLQKVFFPRTGATKGDLLRYYERIAPTLVPYLTGRAMVMKRYPDGADGAFFFMKRTPSSHPSWLRTCSIEHGSGSVIAFPVIDDVAALLWTVNLGCIDLNPWYGAEDDVDRPDVLHFDLDPDAETPFERVADVARLVRDALGALDLPAYVKTSGSSGVHVYVPIVRGPLQKTVWTFAKAFAVTIAKRHPEYATAEYRIAKRPPGRVLIDYNQNAWGRTLASVYSVRPTAHATVSTPLTWDELAAGARPGDFPMESVPDRIAVVGDLWMPMRTAAGRADLERYA